MGDIPHLSLESCQPTHICALQPKCKPPEAALNLRGWVPNADRVFIKIFIQHSLEMADFVNPAANLTYDPKLARNLDHILTDNFDRLPPHFQIDQRQAPGALSTAIDVALKRLRRNYKLAVPQWYPGHDALDIQLLLPLDLTNKGSADLTLVIFQYEGVYLGNTILTLDMAYSNATPNCSAGQRMAEAKSQSQKPIFNVDGDVMAALIFMNQISVKLAERTQLASTISRRSLSSFDVSCTDCGGRRSQAVDCLKSRHSPCQA
jgi:hypothetical protein